MNWPDYVNGGYELLGAFAVSLNIIKLHKDKHVAGVSWAYLLFFISWGCWNLYYYPYLGQWISFVGGVAIMICNTIWLGQIIYYSRRVK